jgi:hypothetical protein
MEFGVPMKLVKLITMCLIETYSKVRIGKYLSDSFPLQNYLEQRDSLAPLLHNLSLVYGFRKVLQNEVKLKLNETHHLLLCADDANLLGITQMPQRNHKNFNLWLVNRMIHK